MNGAASSGNVADLGANDMDLFRELFVGPSHLGQVLSLLQLALTIWMAIDAYQVIDLSWGDGQASPSIPRWTVRGRYFISTRSGVPEQQFELPPKPHIDLL